MIFSKDKRTLLKQLKMLVSSTIIFRRSMLKKYCGFDELNFIGEGEEFEQPPVDNKILFISICIKYFVIWRDIEV
jgi:hypothetical protein